MDSAHKIAGISISLSAVAAAQAKQRQLQAQAHGVCRRGCTCARGRIFENLLTCRASFDLDFTGGVFSVKVLVARIVSDGSIGQLAHLSHPMYSS